MKSHGDGRFTPSQLARVGRGVVFEEGVLVFHPENVEIGDDVYIGHGTMLKGYHRNRMVIGSGTWIGQQCFLHAAGGIVIEDHVGVGPGVRILTSSHRLDDIEQPILHAPLDFAPVHVERDADIGVGAILMPGVRIGRGAQVAAGAVVTHDAQPYAIVAGVPAKFVRRRGA